MFRIVLEDVPNPLGSHLPLLYRRGQTVPADTLPPDLPADKCTARAFPPDRTLYLIDSFDCVTFFNFTTLRVGDSPEKKPRSRNDLDVYGPELGDERCRTLVIAKGSSNGLFVRV